MYFEGDGAIMRKRTSVLMMLVTLFAVFGCATYGKVGPMGQALTIDTLKKNWQNYDVYCTGFSELKATGILFDPRNHDKRLTFERDKWFKVEKEDSLSVIIEGMQDNTVFYPILYQLLGPDDSAYGYIYTGYRYVVTKPVDQKTLYVNNLPRSLEAEQGFG